MMSSPNSTATSPVFRITSLGASMTRRISNLFHLSHDQLESEQSEQSDQFSNTFEVPLFMSRSGEHGDFNGRLTLYSNSVNIASLGEADNDRNVETLNSRSSSVYSNSPSAIQSDSFDVENRRLFSRLPESQQNHDEDMQNSPFPCKPKATWQTPQQRRRKRVSQTTLRKLHVKARLSIAFGITLLVTLVIYIGLAASGAGSGTMFHAMCVVLLIFLAGVFGHSFISLVMLMRRKRIKVRGRGRWWGFNERKPLTTIQKKTSIGKPQTKSPENAFPIIMVADEEAALEAQTLFGSVKALRPPPPVYGNFRGSTRIDPNLVYFQRTSPSPTTPTYDEAMRSAQLALGYQPPRYHSSPSRTSRQSSSVHPLERERICRLMKDVRPSRQQQ